MSDSEQIAALERRLEKLEAAFASSAFLRDVLARVEAEQDSPAAAVIAPQPPTAAEVQAKNATTMARLSTRRSERK
jgi:hypothetical protein